MSDDRLNRRRLLQMGGTALTAALAGCNEVDPRTESGTDEPITRTGNPFSDEDGTQEYTIPPVAELVSDGVPEGDNVITMDARFEPATTPGDSTVYFEDELTFELFVYDTYPVGNEVELTKVAEKTSTPQDAMSETLEMNYEDLPKNEQIRFRLRITNNNTGDSEWQMDQRVFHYEQYGDRTFAFEDVANWTQIEGTDGQFRRQRFYSVDDGHSMFFSGGLSFTSPEIIDELPYSREAFRDEIGDYESSGQNPVCKPCAGREVTFSSDQVNLSRDLMNQYDTGHYYNSFTLNAPVSGDYEYQYGEEYDVLNHPIYTEMAEAIDEAHSNYGINNHYSKINQAARLIQTNEYDQITGSIRDAPIHLPEAYWQDPAENCVGHTFQMCWLLYHMGYTCGTVWLSRSGRNASHLAVAMPVPEDVMVSDFPEGYPETFDDAEVPSTYYIYTVSDRVGPDSRPETTGEYKWIYIEATTRTALGVIPFDEVDTARIRFAIEPEDNVFGTDIGAPNNR